MLRFSEELAAAHSDIQVNLDNRVTQASSEELILLEEFALVMAHSNQVLSQWQLNFGLIMTIYITVK